MTNIVELPTVKRVTLEQALAELIKANTELDQMQDDMEVVILLGVPKDKSKAYLFQQLMGRAESEPLLVSGLLSYCSHIYQTMLLESSVE